MTLDDRLVSILDRLARKAWVQAPGQQPGRFVLSSADLAPGNTADSLHAALQAIYSHARRWAPGFNVPFFVPPIRIGPLDSAGEFLIDEGYASITVSAKYLDNDAALLMILCHEACHHILLQAGLAQKDDLKLDEITTDLAMFICGFGEIVLSGHRVIRGYTSNREQVHLGYLGSDVYRDAHEWVLQRRHERGLSVHSMLGSLLDDASAMPAPAREEPADGLVELFCGDAFCKRGFRTKLRSDGDPWPVRCPQCGAGLYPADILELTPIRELHPQHAELRLFSHGRLVATTAASLRALVPASDKSAPAPAVDGAALLAAMLEDATPETIAQTPPPPKRTETPIVIAPIVAPTSRTPTNTWIVVLVLLAIALVVLVLVAQR